MIINHYPCFFGMVFLVRLIKDSSAFVQSSSSSPRSVPKLVMQESGRVGWEAELELKGHRQGSADSDSNFSTESAGEATTRLGLNSKPTVWTEFGRLAQDFDNVNLGQGFPDWMPPEFAVEALVEAAQDQMNSPHQYTRPAGHPNLVNQLAKRYSVHMGRTIEPMTEVAVTVGASQSLYLSLQTLIKPGKRRAVCSSLWDKEIITPGRLS